MRQHSSHVTEKRCAFATDGKRHLIIIDSHAHRWTRECRSATFSQGSLFEFNWGRRVVSKVVRIFIRCHFQVHLHTYQPGQRTNTVGPIK